MALMGKSYKNTACVASKLGGELMQFPHNCPLELNPHCGQALFECQGKSFRHASQTTRVLACVPIIFESQSRHFCLNNALTKPLQFNS
jgi:hypothetical protein